MIHPDLYGVRTLIFDMDGTLVQSGKLALHALREGLAEFYRRRGKEAPEKTDKELLAGIGQVSDVFYRSLLPESLRGEWREFRALIFESERRYLETHRLAYPGAVKTLAELRRRGYRLAVATNGNREYAEAMMETQGLARFFDRVACIEDVPGGGTKEEVIALLVRELGGDAAMIGDRVYDITAARKNGLPAVGALYGYGSREELGETADWVRDIRELLYLFDPLKELAEALADEINSARRLDRAMIVALSAPHPALTAPLLPPLLISLSEINLPATVLSLDRHRTDPSPEVAADALGWLKSAYPWERLWGDFLAPERDSRLLEAAWTVTRGRESGRERPYRARPGTLLLVEGPMLLRSPLGGRFDLRYTVRARPGTVRRALRALLRHRAAGYGETLPPVFEPLRGVLLSEDELDLWERRFHPAWRAAGAERLEREAADRVLDGGLLATAAARPLPKPGRLEH